MLCLILCEAHNQCFEEFMIMSQGACGYHVKIDSFRVGGIEHILNTKQFRHPATFSMKGILVEDLASSVTSTRQITRRGTSGAHNPKVH